MANNRYDDIMGLPLHMWYGIAVAAEVDGAWDREDCRIRSILDTVSDIMETGGNGQGGRPNAINCPVCGRMTTMSMAR